ncbi:MAG TPA: ArgE/DapE family deacylase [Euzebya sp.]|nr:ArgE/DapE family deacylase [Euzebya sp.]
MTEALHGQLPIVPTQLSAAEQRVLEAIRPSALLDLLADLVAQRTVSAAEEAGQRLVAQRLAGMGLQVDTWTLDVADLQRHPAFSAEVERVDPLGVVGRMGRGTGPVLLLDGHIDVVPPGIAADWSSPAFLATVTDGRVVGRGTCDMKGGLAAAMIALQAIGSAGVQLAGTALLASVVGEEDGGCGTLGLLMRLQDQGLTADGCLIMEPTDLAVVPASAGALSWRITVRGQSAHGCLREEGVSAIERFAVVHAAVLGLERRRNSRTPDPLFAWLDRPFAICGGRIEGGDWPSSECDWLTWEGRYGVAPGEDLATARAELEAAVAHACASDPWLAAHPATVEWWGGQFLPGVTPLGERIVATTRDAATATIGHEPLVRGMPYGCDLGLTVGVGGIPTVVFGPGDVRDAHRPDESVAVADLVAAARTIAVTAMRFCGVTDG